MLSLLGSVLGFLKGLLGFAQTQALEQAGIDKQAVADAAASQHVVQEGTDARANDDQLSDAAITERLRSQQSARP